MEPPLPILRACGAMLRLRHPNLQLPTNCTPSTSLSVHCIAFTAHTRAHSIQDFLDDQMEKFVLVYQGT